MLLYRICTILYYLQSALAKITPKIPRPWPLFSVFIFSLSLQILCISPTILYLSLTIIFLTHITHNPICYRLFLHHAGWCIFYSRIIQYHIVQQCCTLCNTFRAHNHIPRTCPTHTIPYPRRVPRHIPYSTFCITCYTQSLTSYLRGKPVTTIGAA